ncbi:hypothetical protein HQ496_05585 [bacterium]|nr:hypothetical protein [bacterium]
MFNLDTAIETWGHSLTYRRTILKSDLDELERRVWSDFSPEVPFQYSFLDDDLNKQ